MAELRLGTVVSYEVERGLGTLRDEDGAERRFHCTAISDGSRSIDEGTRVALVLEAAHGGVYEAGTVVKVGTTL